MSSGELKNWLSHFPDHSEFKVVFEPDTNSDSVKETFQVTTSDGVTTTFPQLP